MTPDTQLWTKLIGSEEDSEYVLELGVYQDYLYAFIYQDGYILRKYTLTGEEASGSIVKIGKNINPASDFSFGCWYFLEPSYQSEGRWKNTIRVIDLNGEEKFVQLPDSFLRTSFIRAYDKDRLLVLTEGIGETYTSDVYGYSAQLYNQQGLPEWSRKIAIVGAVSDIEVVPNQHFYILANAYNQYRNICSVYCYNSLGEKVWETPVEPLSPNDYHDYGEYGLHIVVNKDGSFYVIGNENIYSYSSTGVAISSFKKPYGTRNDIREALSSNNDVLIVTGAELIKQGSSNTDVARGYVSKYNQTGLLSTYYLDDGFLTDESDQLFASALSLDEDGIVYVGGSTSYNYDALLTKIDLSIQSLEYSNDPLKPTPITWGDTNIKISNIIGTATDTADYLTFVVPTGQRLTSLRLENYNSTDAKAFIGIQEGNTVTASASNPAALLGYTHFGPGVSDATVGSDLISKFGGPLTEGTYSIWIQQLGAPTNYTLNLTLEQVQTVTPAYPINIPKTTAGTEVKIADTTHPAVLITSNGSPDYIQVQAPVSVTLDALSSGTHTAGYIARNVGTPNTPGTGQVVYLNGLSKYSFVETAIEAATTTINLEPSKNSAFFLHDAYSAFYSGLTLSPDSNGRQSTQRVLNVDKIKMGSAGGTSIVDLTSKDYITGDVTIYSAQKGRSIIWGGGSNDTMISNGADLIVYGGGGTNQIQLGGGKDTIQLRSGAGAKDRVIGFTPGVDKVELWTGNQEVGIEPQFLLSSDGQSSVMSWAGNTVEFVGIPSLDLATLLPLGRMAA